MVNFPSSCQCKCNMSLFSHLLYIARIYSLCPVFVFKSAGLYIYMCHFVIFQSAGLYVEFEASHDGIYVVTSAPRRDYFDVPVSGCLYNSRLSKHISVRFPKKTTDSDMQCYIQVIHIIITNHRLRHAMLHTGNTQKSQTPTCNATYR